MKRRKNQRTARNLHLPSWLKLRTDDGLKNQAKWMIGNAEKVNADGVSIGFAFKHRPWNVILTVIRRHQ